MVKKITNILVAHIEISIHYNRSKLQQNHVTKTQTRLVYYSV